MKLTDALGDVIDRDPETNFREYLRKLLATLGDCRTGAVRDELGGTRFRTADAPKQPAKEGLRKAIGARTCLVGLESPEQFERDVRRRVVVWNAPDQHEKRIGALDRICGDCVEPAIAGNAFVETEVPV